jgi:hypothetical protein
MSRHRLEFSTEGGHTEKVLLDGVEISSAVRGITLSAMPGEMPTGQLEILPLGSMEVRAAVAELSMIDTEEVVQLRSFLMDACDLCERLLSMMTDQQIAEILKTRDTSRQIRLWKVHADGPDAERSFRTYQEKVKRANADPTPLQLTDALDRPEDLDE